MMMVTSFFEVIRSIIIMMNKVLDGIRKTAFVHSFML